jgi:hypothetical protein
MEESCASAKTFHNRVTDIPSNRVTTKIGQGHVICNSEVWVRSYAIHVGFVVDKVALGQVFLSGPRFSAVSIIPPTLRIYISLI